MHALGKLQKTKSKGANAGENFKKVEVGKDGHFDFLAIVIIVIIVPILIILIIVIIVIIVIS